MTKYREAAAQDLRALQELALVSYGRLKTELTPENWTKMESVLLSDQTFPLLVKTCHCFVCEKNGQLTRHGLPCAQWKSDKNLFSGYQLYPHGGCSSRCGWKRNRSDP